MGPAEGLHISGNMIGQIAVVKLPRIVLDVAHTRVIVKLMGDLSYMNDFWKDDESGRCIEEKTTCNDFDNTYLADNKYTLVLTAIMGKAGQIKEKKNKMIS